MIFLLVQITQPFRSFVIIDFIRRSICIHSNPKLHCKECKLIVPWQFCNIIAIKRHCFNPNPTVFFKKKTNSRISQNYIDVRSQHTTRVSRCQKIKAPKPQRRKLILKDRKIDITEKNENDHRRRRPSTSIRSDKICRFQRNHAKERILGFQTWGNADRDEQERERQQDAMVYLSGSREETRNQHHGGCSTS